MFSGIIQAVVPVHTIYEELNFKTYVVIFPQHLLSNIKIGSSISNNGCCLTVITIQHNYVSFNLIHETLKLTNMGILQVGDLINVEEPIKYHKKIEGHLMTGHIDCTGEIKKIIHYKKNKTIWIKMKNKYYQKYIIQKGSIGIDGVSLTINKVLGIYIRICLIPYTIKKTTLGTRKIGDIVNIEIDFFVKTITNTVERILSNI